MYAYLQGKFLFKSPAQVQIDVNGIGFEVNISLHTYSKIQSLTEGRLLTYLQIKEDAHVLFGFFDQTEKDLFVMLLSVSGIGASTARMMLSNMKPTEVCNAIAQGNVKLLESIKGIGKKTAERLVLELKDKVGKGITEINVQPTLDNRLESDALNALISLGISKPQAESAIKKIMLAQPDNIQLEELIKKALRDI
jgi:Holliday junction DNA helicase RuvA